MLDTLSAASLGLQSQSCPASLAAGGAQQHCETECESKHTTVIKDDTDLYGNKLTCLLCSVSHLGQAEYEELRAG